MKLHEKEVVGMYTDEKSKMVAFMLDNHWIVVYKYAPEAGVCFREHRSDEPIIDIMVDKDTRELVELTRISEGKG